MFKSITLNMSLAAYYDWYSAKAACGQIETTPPYSAVEGVEFYTNAVDGGIIFG